MDTQRKLAPKTLRLITMRIRVDILERIDNEVEKRFGMKRTSWIMEAIQEKFKKDLKNESIV